MFLDALDLLEIRQERVPEDLGDEVFFNLGRFSRVLGEFESLRSVQPPLERVSAFHAYAAKSAKGEHEEGMQASEYSPRDAVRITTVHRAKGLQWPVVFLPGLGEGRFPSAPKEQTLWDLVPREVVRAPQRYESGEEDERRLFYVAATRAQKFLFASWAVGRYGKPRAPGAYFQAFAAAPGVETVNMSLRGRPRAQAAPKPGVTDLRLTFSEIKPMFECPYRFRLQGVYGFRAPIEEAQGFGKALHDALAEVHRRAIEGDILTVEDVPRLLERHLHLPYASPATFARLQENASAILSRYLLRQGPRLAQIELAEKPIEVQMGDGVAVEGRIDLVYRRDRGDVSVVDLKSDRRAQTEALSEAQLRIYALGYEELTGQRPQQIEVWELDRMRERPSAVDDGVLKDVRERVLEVAKRVRTGDMPPMPSPERCSTCGARAVRSARIEAENDAAPRTERG
jgi:DNA helicase-2/ATP-dependent DNA helicase PcrA